MTWNMENKSLSSHAGEYNRAFIVDRQRIGLIERPDGVTMEVLNHSRVKIEHTFYNL